MSNQTPEWKAMSKLVSRFYAKAEFPFLKPVDWHVLGLMDYPLIITKPMDLGSVKHNLGEEKYNSIYEAAKDVHLIWKNCKIYNKEGSDIFNLAQSLEDEFKEKLEKICSTSDGGTLG